MKAERMSVEWSPQQLEEGEHHGHQAGPLRPGSAGAPSAVLPDQGKHGARVPLSPGVRTERPLPCRGVGRSRGPTDRPH